VTIMILIMVINNDNNNGRIIMMIFRSWLARYMQAKSCLSKAACLEQPYKTNLTCLHGIAGRLHSACLVFTSYLTAWGVEPILTHQTFWLESTSVQLAIAATLGDFACAGDSQGDLQWGSRPGYSPTACQ